MTRSRLAPFHALRNRLGILGGRRRAHRELTELSHHALSDIGLRREELPSHDEFHRQVLITNLSGMR